MHSHDVLNMRANEFNGVMKAVFTRKVLDPLENLEVGCQESHLKDTGNMSQAMLRLVNVIKDFFQ